jgi:hypothetical protein
MRDSDLRNELLAWRFPRDGYALLTKAAENRTIGSELLAEQLRTRTNWVERPLLAVALGQASGSSGIEELRAAANATGPHTRDLKHAALTALARRLGSHATSDLVAALSDRDTHVRLTALQCLVICGDRTAYDAVLREVSRLVKVDTLSYVTEASLRSGIAFLVLAGAESHLEQMRVVLDSWLDTKNGRLLFTYPHEDTSPQLTLEELVSEATKTKDMIASTFYRNLPM